MLLTIFLACLRGLMLVFGVTWVVIGYSTDRAWMYSLACAALGVYSSWNPITLYLLKRKAEAEMEAADAAGPGTLPTAGARHPRPWIRLDTGVAIPAEERPGGTHLWDFEGNEWVCISPSPGVWVWKDPADVYKIVGGKVVRGTHTTEGM